jgi:FkbM family methyltransferase
MKKASINHYLRRFGVELHGLGYLEKMSKDSFKSDPYKAQTAIINKNLCKAIFDVGANSGLSTRSYLDLFPNATIHAFEPIPSLVNIFNERHASNKRVVLNEVAVTNKIGEENFNVNKSIDTSSLLQSTKIGGTSDEQCKTINRITVKTDTLDSYCLRHRITDIDILKIDTQGSEFNILNGATRLLDNQQVKLVFCEVYFKEQYVDQPLFYDIASFLKTKGYELQDIYETIYNSRRLLWGDAIFVKSSLL